MLMIKSVTPSKACHVTCNLQTAVFQSSVGNMLKLGWTSAKIFWWIALVAVCMAAVQLQGRMGPAATLRFRSVGSVHEHNSPLTLQLIRRWLWRWPLWRSVVWSRPQSKCPWMKYWTSNCSPMATAPHAIFVCVCSGSFVRRSELYRTQIVWF